MATHLNVVLAACYYIACSQYISGYHEPPTKTQLGEERHQLLIKNLDSFRLELTYYGEQDLPYYKLILSTHPSRKDNSSYTLREQINDGQATKILQYLLKAGFLARAITEEELESELTTSGADSLAGYVISISAGKLKLAHHLGWDLKMLRQLDSFKEVLEGKASKSMDRLIYRLGGHRRVWEEEEKASNLNKTP